ARSFLVRGRLRRAGLCFFSLARLLTRGLVAAPLTEAHKREGEKEHEHSHGVDLPFEFLIRLTPRHRLVSEEDQSSSIESRKGQHVEEADRRREEGDDLEIER